MVIEATDSDFWPCLAVRAINDGEDHPEVKVTVSGVPSETDVDKRVSILESLVAKTVPGLLCGRALGGDGR